MRGGGGGCRGSALHSCICGAMRCVAGYASCAVYLYMGRPPELSFRGEVASPQNALWQVGGLRLPLRLPLLELARLLLPVWVVHHVLTREIAVHGNQKGDHRLEGRTKRGASSTDRRARRNV